MTGDHWNDEGSGIGGPAFHATAITPSDTATLTKTPRAIYVGVAGDLKVKMLGGETVIFSNAPVGWHPIRVTQVFATGTAASGIVGAW